MTKIRGGLKLGKRIRWVSRWIFRRNRMLTDKPISRLLRWGRRLTDGAKSMCRSRRRLSYVRLDNEEKAPAVPKGHLAVYVGQNDGEFHRVTVPVIYFNHPLFGELLREVEKEYGFRHPGGITIPFRIRSSRASSLGSSPGGLPGGRHGNSAADDDEKDSQILDDNDTCRLSSFVG